MTFKAILVICLQAVLFKDICGQCIPGGPFIDDYAISQFGAGAPFGYGPYEPVAIPRPITLPNGGVFAVSSFSPIAPTGISVLSENAIDGLLSVVGEMPFLGAVALDGSLPSVGTGGINYGCGNGNVAIISESLNTPYPSNLGYNSGLTGYGYGPGLSGLGYVYGCGGIY